MQIFTILSATLLASLTSAGTIFFTGQSDCSGDGSTQSPGPEGLECRQLGGINSAKATQIDDGCSFTVYTSSDCSADPTLAGLGQCITGASINSFSYDC